MKVKLLIAVVINYCGCTRGHRKE